MRKEGYRVTTCKGKKVKDFCSLLSSKRYATKRGHIVVLSLFSDALYYKYRLNKRWVLTKKRESK